MAESFAWEPGEKVGCALEETPSGTKGRWRGLLALLPLVVGVLLGLILLALPIGRYSAGQLLLACGQYETGERFFAAAGDFRDAGEWAQLAQSMETYRRGRQLFAQGSHAEAREVFLELGDFRDARARSDRALYAQANHALETGDYYGAGKLYRQLGDYLDAKSRRSLALHMYQVECDYCAAESALEMGTYLNAMDRIQGIRGENYPGIEDLYGRICEEMLQRLREELEMGRTPLALRYLEELEKAGSAGEGLRESLLERYRLEPDTGYHDRLVGKPIQSITADTSAAEYSTVCASMYLRGEDAMTVQADGTLTMSQYLAMDTEMKGARLADCLLPEYASIFDPHWNFRNNGYSVLSMELHMEYDLAQDSREAKTHIEGFSDYCAETLELLSENLLLTNRMNSRQKAMVLLYWVDQMIDYDHSYVIHDAYTAIREDSGVCESYVALYHRLCNLAGIPTYGQIGYTNGGRDETHIWTFHLDEAGEVFYCDPTWADDDSGSWGVDMEAFLAQYMDSAEEIEALYRSGRQDAELPWLPDAPELDMFYFWTEELWSSHEAIDSTQEIMEAYAYNAK